MKATIEIPDELYRQVKAKSALEGRPVREVTEELYRLYVHGHLPEGLGSEPDPATEIDSASAPSWFGALREYADTKKDHDLAVIRESIARGIESERNS